MKKVILTSLLLIVSPKIFAGKSVGNGGDAVVCYTDATKGQVSSVTLFDYWEQGQVRQIPGGVSLGQAGLTPAQKIKIVTDRIGQFDPELAERVSVVANSLALNVNDYLVNAATLPEIEDANPAAVPTRPNCFLEQFAVQYKNLTTGERRFAISSRLFNDPNTSPDDRIGLILHEAIYRFALQNGVQDSDGVRAFNYYVSTKRLDGGETGKYFEIFERAKIHGYGCFAYEVKEKDRGVDYIYARSRQELLNRNHSCFTQAFINKSHLHMVMPQNSLFERDGLESTYSFKPPAGNSLKIRYKQPGSGAWKNYVAFQVLTQNYEPKNLSYLVWGISPMDLKLVTPGFSAACGPSNTIEFNARNTVGELATCTPAQSSIAVNGRLVKTQGPVAMDKANTDVYQFQNTEPAEIDLESKTYRLKAQSKLKIKSNGELFTGELLTPFASSMPGTTVPVLVNGLRDGFWVARHVPILHQSNGKISLDENTKTAAKNYLTAVCAQIHPLLKNVNIQVVTSYIEKPTVFFDVLTQSPQTKTDEHVTFIDSYDCEGVFKF